MVRALRRVVMDTGFLLGLTAAGALQAGLTVTAEPAVEGDREAGQRKVRFSVVLSAPEATTTVWEYATSADTAREGSDFVGVRGSVSFAAGETVAMVEVPLISDDVWEPDESLALIVWPAGETPVPALTAVRGPVGPAPASWPPTPGSIPLSEGQFYREGYVGRREEAGWRVDRPVVLPPNPEARPLSSALDGASLVLSDLGPQEAISRQRFWHYDTSSTQSPLVSDFSGGARYQWHPSEPELPRSAVAMAGGRLAVRTDRSIDFFRIGIGRPPAFQFTRLLPLYAGGALAFDGRRCIYSVSLNPNTRDVKRGLAVMEAIEGDVVEATGDSDFIEDVTGPMSVEGDTLLAARRETGPGPWGFYAVLKRNPGVDGKWIDKGSLPIPPDGWLGRNWMVVMRGPVALVADAGVPGHLWSREGRILVYVRDAAASQWHLSGSFKSPDTAPADGFGIALGHAGLDVAVQSAGGLLYAGSFSGAVATVVDDDMVAGTLTSATITEPLTGTTEMRLRFDLEDPSDEEVTFSWRTRDGSALAGSDYLAQDGSVTLAPGEMTGWLAVPVVADAEREEEEESFAVEITRITGARLAGNADAQVRCRILPPARPETVVVVEGASVYEDVPGGDHARVGVYPRGAGESVTIDWRTAAVAPLGTTLTPSQLQLAQLGLDLPASAGTFTLSSDDVRFLPLAVESDDLKEGAERASLAVSLPPLATAGTFGVRCAVWPPSTAFRAFLQASTDGDWVAAAEDGARLGLPPEYPEVAAFHLFTRDAGAPGGWKLFRIIRPGEVGLSAFPGGRMMLRQGRLIYYAYHLGLIWVFRSDIGGPGAWGLEATLRTDPVVKDGRGWLPPQLEFDGQTLVHATVPWPYVYARIVIHAFEAGRWQPREEHLDFEFIPNATSRYGWKRHPKIAGDTIVFFTGTNDTSPMIGRIRRDGPPGARWSMEPPVQLEGPPMDRSQSDGMLFDGDRLVLGLSNIDPVLTHVYRRQPNDAWTLEAALPDRPEDLQPGLFRGKKWLWRETGDAAAPWQAVAPNEIATAWPLYPYDTTPPDRHRQVAVSIGTLPQPGVASGVAGLLIAEPGADWQILDEDSVTLSASVAVPAREAVERAEPAVIEVTASIPVPADVTIPYATVPGGTAVAGIDYTPVSGELRLAAGQQSARFAIPILPDAVIDPGETVFVEIGEPSFGSLASPRTTLTIADRLPMVLPPDAPTVVTEPASGEQSFDIVFRMPLAFDHPISVPYTIASGTAGANDVHLSSGALTVPAGATAFRIPLTVRADLIEESSEYVVVRVTPPGATQPISTQVTIAPPLPVAGAPDLYAAIQDQVMEVIPEQGVRSNDAPGILSTQLHTAPLHGQATWQPDGSFTYRPSPNFIGVDRLTYLPDNGGGTLVDASATWKWRHPVDGRDPELSQPGFQQGWTQPDFDDASWPDGTGLMAYGVIGPGEGMPITTPIGTPPAGSRFTAYFRTRFVAPADPPNGLTVQIAVDDASIIYLNGVEIGRTAPSVDPVFMAAADAYTLGCALFHDLEQETTVLSLRFPKVQVRPGSNVLAVSVHNQQPNSSDLAFRLEEVSNALQTSPIEVNLTVQDAGRPPVVADDSYSLPVMAGPVDSHRLPEGSAYRNDGLLNPYGAAFDPILEAETGGSPAGPVTFDAASGHFQVAVPPDFFGTTAFTYRVRDKDGWSNEAVVTLVVPPSRAFDVWRQQFFGGGSDLAASGALADDDGDGLVNLAEFALGTDPRASESVPSLNLLRDGEAWVVDILTRDGFGNDVFLGLEGTDSLTEGAWARVAWLNDVFPSVQDLASGVQHRSASAGEGMILHSLTLPPDASASGFLRLRVARERHPLDP